MARRVKRDTPVGRPTITIDVDVANEQLVLASMMRDRVILRDCATSLGTSLFIGERHQELFRVLREIQKAGHRFDLEILEHYGGKREYGSRRYVEKLLDAYTEPPKNLEFHLEKLRNDSTKYRLRVGPIQDLLDIVGDPMATVDEVQKALGQIQSQIASKPTTGAQCGQTLYESYLADLKGRIKNPGFVPTGYSELDECLTEGLASQNISIWAARPSMGKSTLVWNIADRVANRFGIPVLFVPLEMGVTHVLDGLISLRTGVPLTTLIKSPYRMNDAELRRVNSATKEITKNEKLTFFPTKPEFQKLENIINQGGYKVVVFDLWEKMLPRYDQETIAIHLSKTRELVQRTHSHAMIVQQIRRGVELRKDKRPTLEDLKNAGAYEENADLVIGLYREGYYDNYSTNKDSDETSILEVGILKQRRGGRLQARAFEFEGMYGRVGRCVKDYYGKEDYD